MRILILTCLVASALAIGRGGVPPNFGHKPNGGQDSGKPCPCTVQTDDDNGQAFGCCQGQGRPRGLAAVKPADTTANEYEQKFLAKVQDDTSRPPKEPRRLATAAKAIPDGVYGPDCDANCVWVKPYCVYVPFTKYGWAIVYQSGFGQYIRYCFCQSKKCHGFFFFYFHWEARCKRVFSYTSLFVWIPETKYNHANYRYESRYVLRQKWFRFPSSCCCGHPTKLSFKYGGH